VKKKYAVIIEKDEEGWLVSEAVGLPACGRRPGCHTQAHTVDRLLERTREAIQAYFEQ
jgi:predicted RNase H-like HicB family nuclease